MENNRDITETIDLLQNLVKSQEQIIETKDLRMNLQNNLIELQTEHINKLNNVINILGVILLITIIVHGARLIYNLYNL